MVSNIEGAEWYKIKPTTTRDMELKVFIIEYPTNRNPTQSFQENAITEFGSHVHVQRLAEISDRHDREVLQLKNSNLGH